MDIFLHKRLYTFLHTCDIFYPSQHGFRHQHSTIHAVTKLVSDIIKNTEAKESTLSVFLALSKAFDTINHDILLKKLELYGIRGIALNWFRSYLSDRQQYVCYDRVKSQPKFINFGIPQGSVLGPLLFIIYTNDLPDCINRATTIKGGFRGGGNRGSVPPPLFQSGSPPFFEEIIPMKLFCQYFYNIALQNTDFGVLQVI